MPECRHSNFEIRNIDMFGMVYCPDCYCILPIQYPLRNLIEDIRKERAKLQEIIQSFEDDGK